MLYPKATAQTAVDMLTAVKPRIQNHYATTDADRLKLFSTGYSEGGAYSLWFYVYIDNVGKSNGNTYQIQTQATTNMVKPFVIR
ncbi:MAG: hypothetical protein IPO58_24175 [Betaproteobacteria bacterium]|nr:hypothetical protein [Betaproteobacteria bacterium]